METIQLNTLKSILAIIPLLITFISSAQSFECTSDLYQVVNGSELKVLIPSKGSYDLVGTSSIKYNGAGFNSEDGYIYGIGAGTVLVKIGKNGQASNLGSIENFSARSYSGDFDLNGNWYSFRKRNRTWIMNKLDVSEMPPVAEQFSITDLGGVENISDQAINLWGNCTKHRF